MTCNPASLARTPMLALCAGLLLQSSLGLAASDDALDISGFRTGSDIDELLQAMQQASPHGDLERYTYQSGQQLAKFIYRAKNHYWTVEGLEDGTVFAIQRISSYDTEYGGSPLSPDLTESALTEKYGPPNLDRSHKMRWMTYRDSEPHECGGALSAERFRRGMDVRLENIRGCDKFIEANYVMDHGVGLITKLTVSIYDVAEHFDYAMAEHDRVRKEKEAQRRKQQERAGAPSL